MVQCGRFAGTPDSAAKEQGNEPLEGIIVALVGGFLFTTSASAEQSLFKEVGHAWTCTA